MFIKSKERMIIENNGIDSAENVMYLSIDPIRSEGEIGSGSTDLARIGGNTVFDDLKRKIIRHCTKQGCKLSTQDIDIKDFEYDNLYPHENTDQSNNDHL